jgi:hypothetical protein
MTWRRPRWAPRADRDAPIIAPARDLIAPVAVPLIGSPRWRPCGPAARRGGADAPRGRGPGDLALTLTLVVEIVVLMGDVGRMNTVFKFYLRSGCCSA